MDICKKWFKDWKKRYNENIELWNTDKEACSKAITGHDLAHNTWRMMRISGAVDHMGGFANFSHYINKSAEHDYEMFRKQHKIINNVLKKFKPETTAQKRLFEEMKEYIKEVV